MARRSRAAASFQKRYPVSLRDALVSPLVFHHNVPQLAATPAPGHTFLVDSARFAGHRDGAIRTALSRLRDAGDLERCRDEAGREHYRLNAFQRVVSAMASQEPGGEGLVLAITGVDRGEQPNRRYLQQLLQHVGFRSLARNVYVAGAADTAPVEAALGERGLRGQVWLLRCAADDPALLARLRAVFDLERRAKALRALTEAYEAFLFEPGLDGTEFARRVVYSGPIQYRELFLGEPPLPGAVLPADYPLQAARAVLPRALAERGADSGGALPQDGRREGGGVMSGKKVAVIGGGIAGLAAGCYARTSGYEVTVLEAHALPGGLCTSWRRKGYTFDGCIHWLTGARPGSPFYDFWSELKVLPGPRLVDHASFYDFVDPDGRRFRLYCDADRLAAHIAELSPADAEAGRVLAADIKRVAVARPFPMDAPPTGMSLRDRLRFLRALLPLLGVLRRYAGLSARGVASRFRDPLIQRGLATALRAEECVGVGVVFQLAEFHARRNAYPEGGSLAFARRLADRFAALGAELRTGARVERVHVEGGVAKGVRLADGSLVEADHVIAACDLRTVLDRLVDAPRGRAVFEDLFQKTATWPSAVLVNLGFKAAIADPPDCVGENRRFATPRSVGPFAFEEVVLKHYAHDPSLAPPGQSIVSVLIDAADAGLFERLREQDRTGYDELKAGLGEEAARLVTERFPELDGKLEAVDVATPATFVRYTGNHRGAFMTWVETPQNSAKLRALPRTLPDVRNLYLAGMWLMAPGGLPCAVKTGRDAVQLICRADRRVFEP
ncbi:MAG: FAD-dependent oxidoreductase [Myxococcales bacterium]